MKRLMIPLCQRLNGRLREASFSLCIIIYGMMDPDEGCLEGGYVARACVHFDNFLISSGLQVHQNATKWRTDCFWHRASASTATTPPVSLIVLIPACSRSPLELERYRNFFCFGRN